MGSSSLKSPEWTLSHILLIYVCEDLSFSFRFKYTQFTTVSRFAELPIMGTWDIGVSSVPSVNDHGIARRGDTESYRD